MSTNNSNNFPYPLDILHGGTTASMFIPYNPVVYGPTSLESVLGSPTGYTLSSNGPSNTPSYKANPALVLLQEQTSAGTGSFVFTNEVITTRYSIYMVIIDRMINVVGGGGLSITFTNNGVEYTSNYAGGNISMSYNSSTVTAGSSTARIPLTPATTTINSRRFYTQFYLFLPNGGSPILISGISGPVDSAASVCSLAQYGLLRPVGVNVNGIIVRMVNASNVPATTIAGNVSVYGLIT